jgi:hypothetical protein
MKLQQQGYGYNHEQPLCHADAKSNNKRHHLNKEELELQYTGPTIQEALADAGWPTMNIPTRDWQEHAWQLGTVNMDRCKVMSSLKFEEYKMNAQADMLNGNQATIIYASICGEQDLAYMYVIVDLVQSTHHYYSISLIYKSVSKSGNAAGQN